MKEEQTVNSFSAYPHRVRTRYPVPEGGSSLVEYLIVVLILASILIPSLPSLTHYFSDSVKYCVLPGGTVGTGGGILEFGSRGGRAPQCLFRAERVFLAPTPTPEPTFS